MKIPESIKSELTYSRNLLARGLDAAAEIRDGAPDQTLAPEFASAARSAWVPAVIGAAIGVIGVCIARQSRPERRALVGGLLGGVLGFGSGVAWGSREVTAAIARQASKNVGAVRDARWVARHPIAYA